MTKRLKIFFNYFLAPILLIWLGVNLYQQVVEQKDNTQSWQQIKQAFYSHQKWKIILAVVLVFANWGIEAFKWRLLMQSLQKMSFIKAFKATLAGTSFAANTPNRMGEYFGRMIYVEEGKRLQSISLTITGSFSQLIISLIAGCIGLLIYKPYATQINALWLNIIFWGTVSTVMLCLTLYFKLGWLTTNLAKIPFIGKYEFFFKKIEALDYKTLLYTLLLSAFRYCIFLLQYILVLEAFGVQANTIQLISAVSVMFLVMVIIPSFVILEAGIRGTVSVEIFKVFSANVIGIMATGYFIWFINLMMPALFGVLLLVGKKVFKR